MKSNILQENMKRFGTKNIKEQAEEVPEVPAELEDPKAEEKVVAEKTFVFKGAKGTTRSGKPFNNPPYSVDFQIVARPMLDATGKQIGMERMVKADGKNIMQLGQNTIVNFYKNNYPIVMKKKTSTRLNMFLLGMLAMEAKIDYRRAMRAFSQNGLAIQPQGPSGTDLYQDRVKSKYYQVM